MNPLNYFYVWSPTYEIFHHILHGSFMNSPHFHVQGVFVPQEVFVASSYIKGATHFLDGNSVKYQILINILEKHPGETIVFSDVDTIIENPDALRQYLEQFCQYDIVYARSTEKNTTELSTGFGIFRSSPEVIQFVRDIIRQIQNSGLDEMTVLNQSIPSFSGTYAMFEFPYILQTQYYRKYKGQSYVMQITCSNHTSSEINLFEKLVSAASLMDISALISLIPENVLDAMLEFYKTHDPQHYLLQLCQK
jgi:hypothetical protein